MTVTRIEMTPLAPGSPPIGGGGGGGAAHDCAMDRGPEGFPKTGSRAPSYPDPPADLILLRYLWTHLMAG